MASPETDELVDGQYADRPGLRPVLDALLAALPTLGEVTVQARTTLVSLATPRRTFAVIQARTRTRVDLGLRLEHARPGGRLLAARDLGASTVRVALTSPEDVDADVLGLLRQAYAENAAPPPPRRAARRPAPKLGPMAVLIEASRLPGRGCRDPDGSEYHNVHIALCTRSKDRPALIVPGKPWLATGPVPGDSPSARWEATVTVGRDGDGFDFSGPFVRGGRGDRNLFLAWGDLPGDGTLQLIRGSKLGLSALDPRLIEDAMRAGHRLAARLRLAWAGPESALAWSAEPARPGQRIQ